MNDTSHYTADDHLIKEGDCLWGDGNDAVTILTIADQSATQHKPAAHQTRRHDTGRISHYPGRCLTRHHPSTGKTVAETYTDEPGSPENTAPQ